MRPRAITILLSGGGLLALLALAFVVFPDAFINGYVKGRNVRAFEAAHPGHTLLIADLHFDFWHNRLTCDSVALAIPDSGFSGRISAVSMDNVGWFELLRGRVFAAKHLTNSSFSADSAMFTFERSGYVLRCSRLTFSARDSLMEIENLELAPLMDDEDYFAVRPLRRPRYHLVIPRWTVTGARASALVEEKRISGRVARVEGLALDILVNKDKPKAGDPVPARPPHQMLAAMRGKVEVDSLAIIDAGFAYGERFAVGGAPAVVTFDSIQLSIGGMAGEAGEQDSAVVQAQAIFMNDGIMTMRLAAPHSEDKYSFQYSGSLTRMNLTRLNTFLEIAERRRIKSGVVQRASFDITVRNERATGSLRATYSGLNIAILDPETGRERLTDRVTSFFVNTFKIRNDNPDNSGEFALGNVSYSRARDQRLPAFLWFALRTGVNDLVGF